MLKFVRGTGKTFEVMFALALAMGCTTPRAEQDVSTVGARGMGVDRSSQALALDSLTSIDGTYVGCTDRSGDWSVHMDGDALPLVNAALSVVKGDVACTLRLTALHGVLATVETVYFANPTFDLDDAYQALGSAFRVAPNDAGPAGNIFYSNAMMSALTFQDDFTITVIYSDDPRRSNGSSVATYSSWSGSATDQMIPAPQYTIDMSSMPIETDVSDVVTSFINYAQLSSTGQVGEFYVVFPGVLSGTPSYAAIQAAYGTETPIAMPVNLQIPATAFSDVLLARDLTTPVVGYVIIVHEVAAVPSYELITITFNPPA